MQNKYESMKQHDLYSFYRNLCYFPLNQNQLYVYHSAIITYAITCMHYTTLSQNLYTLHCVLNRLNYNCDNCIAYAKTRLTTTMIRYNFESDLRIPRLYDTNIPYGVTIRELCKLNILCHLSSKQGRRDADWSEIKVNRT